MGKKKLDRKLPFLSAALAIAGISQVTVALMTAVDVWAGEIFLGAAFLAAAYVADGHDL